MSFRLSDGLARGRMLHSAFSLLDVLMQRAMPASLLTSCGPSASCLASGQSRCRAYCPRWGSWLPGCMHCLALIATLQHAVQANSCVEGLQDFMALLAREYEALHERGMREGFAPGSAGFEEGTLAATPCCLLSHLQSGAGPAVHSEPLQASWQSAAWWHLVPHAVRVLKQRELRW